MGRYRRVDTRIWNDEKFAGLSDHAKLVFLLLLTHPHMTSLGAMRATAPGLAAELSWETKVFAKALGELGNHQMVQYDPRASLIWLPNFLRYNRPENPNVVKSWEGVLDLLPECETKLAIAARVRTEIEPLGEPFTKALPEPFQKGLLNPSPNPSEHNAKPFRIPEPYPYPEPYTETLSPGEFEPFWERYPKKRSKEDARKAWKALRPTTWEAAVLMAAVAAALSAEEWQRENGRFIPYAAT